jgi:hypothetical protein
MRYVGVDLHKTQFSVCWKEEDGSDKFERYAMSAEGLRRFRERLDGETEVGVEATANSKYFYDQVVGTAKKVRVINPLQFKIISESVKKTDREDCVPRRPPFLWVKVPRWQLPVQPSSEECM